MSWRCLVGRAAASAGAVGSCGRGSCRAVSSTVLIKGLPVAVPRDELFDHCEDFGSISSMFISESQSGKQSIATVTFKKVSSALSIVDELDNMNLMGRKVGVSFSTRLDQPRTSPKVVGPAKTKNLD